MLFINNENSLQHSAAFRDELEPFVKQDCIITALRLFWVLRPPTRHNLHLMSRKLYNICWHIYDDCITRFAMWAIRWPGGRSRHQTLGLKGEAADKARKLNPAKKRVLQGDWQTRGVDACYITTDTAADWLLIVRFRMSIRS